MVCCSSLVGQAGTLAASRMHAGNTNKTPSQAQIHTNTHPLNFSTGAGQWPKAVGVQCSSQVRDCERIQHSLLAVNKHVFWLNSIFTTVFSLFFSYKLSWTFTKHTQSYQNMQQWKKINPITLCTVVEM